MMNEQRRKQSARQASKMRPKVIQAPIARGATLSVVNPNINGGDTIRIRKRELVRTLIDPVAGNIDFLHIDPTDHEAFPWLANISQLYEMYRIHNLSFEFRSSSPTTASGAFYSAIDYDPDDAHPESVDNLMSYVGATRCPIWTAQQNCRFDTRRVFKPWLYTAKLKSGSSNRLESPGKYYYSAAPPTVAGNSVGEIYVNYDISFKNTQRPSGKEVHFNGSLTRDLQLPASGGDWSLSGDTSSEIIRTNVTSGLDLTPKKGGLYYLKMALSSEDGANAFVTRTTGGALINEIRRGVVKDITDTVKSQFIEAFVWFPRKFSNEVDRASLHFRQGTALLKTLSVALSFMTPKILGVRNDYTTSPITFG